MFERDIHDVDELLKRHGEEARRTFDSSGFSQMAPVIKPTEVKQLELKHIAVEYLVRGDDVIYHLFRRTETYWRQTDRERIWNVFAKGFRLTNYPERLVIEWVPEMYSWCITLKGIAAFALPSEEMLQSVAYALEE